MGKTSEALSVALQHHQAGQLQQAERIYREILQVDAHHADALHLLGVLAHQVGRHELALDYIRRAIESEPANAAFHNNMGGAYQAMRRFDEAVASYERAIQIKPDFAEAHFKLGLALKNQGNFDDAVASYQRAVQLKPDYAEAYGNLGNALQSQGKLDEAVASYRRALQLKPDYALAHGNLGAALASQGKLAEAAASYQQALRIKPDHAAVHSNLGNVLRDQGKLDEAAASYRRALQIKPDFAEAFNNLGNVLKDQEKLVEAVASYQRAVQLAPDYADAHSNLGGALENQGKLDEAVASYRRALQIQPDFAGAHGNLGIVLKAQGKLDEAVASYRRALRIDPEYAEAHYNLGIALRDQGQLDEAVACYRRALQINPDYAWAHNNLGNALKDQGKLDEAVASYRRALEHKPEFADAHSNLIMTEQYLSGVSLADLEACHAAWNRQHAEPLKSEWRPFPHVRDPSRRLRLGFVSPDFGRHPVAYFFVRCLEALNGENLNGERCETVCYSDRVKKDDLTQRISASAELWRDVKGLSDAALAQQIREDQIDVLFDLAGHTAGNRLLVFARKPAPVQVTWIGYVGTTGLAAIDYLVADRFHVPEGAEAKYREQVLRLPDARFCYDPPADAPSVGPLPAKSRGSVTFGSLNNPAKVTPDVLATWAEILRRVPEARLILKYRGLDDSGTAKRYWQLLAGLEVNPAQIELRGWSGYHQALAEYNEIDVALDTFPFCGATTTCEALWMGVPVVTCPLETFASRQTLCILSNLGVTSTVASDPAHYVQLAVSLAQDLPRLAELRAGLRQQMADSPLCDARRFTVQFMQAIRDVWRRWCDTEGR